MAFCCRAEYDRAIKLVYGEECYMRIYLVFKTHFDIGFTDLSSTIIRQYAEQMLPEVIETCDMTADMGALHYVWTMPSWPLTIMQRNHEFRPDLDRLIKNGQIVWHALPFTSHFDFSGMEDTIQGLQYAVQLSKEYGIPLPVSAKMTDVPGHGRALPMILANAGIRFLHLGCNEFATPPDVPPLFFWQGPDGSRLLTMYSAGGYGSSLFPPSDWPFPVWMALMHTHDNSGPQSAEMIRDMVDTVRRQYPDAEIICGSMDDFYHSLSACDLSSVPVITDDLADSWIHGAGTYPAETAAVRQARRDILTAGIMSFATGQGRSVVAHEATAAYNALALFDEHTWGLDVKTWMNAQRVYEKDAFLQVLSSDEYRRMEASWQEQRDRAYSAQQHASAALRAVQGGGYSAFNPNGSPFTGWAQATDDISGVIPLAGRNMIYVKDVPALSSQTVQPPEYPTADIDTLENHRYRLTLNQEQGIITELYDKVLGCTLLEARDGIGVFSYRYDIYGIQDVTEYLRSYAYRFSDWGVRDNMKDNYPNCMHQSFTPAFCGLQVDGFTVTLQYQSNACQEYGDAQDISIEIALPPLGDELFIRVHLSDKQPTPFTESGCLAFPLAENHPQYLMNKNGSLIDPAHDIADCANHALYCIEDFLCAQGSGDGLCLLSEDAPLFSIGETGIYTYRKQYEAHDPILYCNLFNNMWGTNFPQWISGSLDFRFTLFGYRGHCNSDTYCRALQLAQGAYVLSTPPCTTGLMLPKGVSVMSLLPDGDDWLLHLRDTALTERTGVLGVTGWNITPVDLRGTKIGDPRPDRIEFPIHAYSLRAFRLSKINKPERIDDKNAAKKRLRTPQEAYRRLF